MVVSGEHSWHQMLIISAQGSPRCLSFLLLATVLHRFHGRICLLLGVAGRCLHSLTGGFFHHLIVLLQSTVPLTTASKASSLVKTSCTENGLTYFIWVNFLTLRTQTQSHLQSVLPRKLTHSQVQEIRTSLGGGLLQDGLDICTER